MSQIMKTFLGVFLIMFMVVTSSGVLSGFMTVVEAQNLHAQIINELEDSDYDSSVAQTCFENASKAGDTLELKLYMTDNSTRKVLQRISAQHMLLLNSEKCYRVSELKLHSCLFYLI